MPSTECIFVATAMMIDRTLELTNLIRELCAKIDAAAGDDEEIKNLTTQLRAAVKEHMAGVRVMAERSYPMNPVSSRQVKPESALAAGKETTGNVVPPPSLPSQIPAATGKPGDTKEAGRNKI